MCLIVDTNVFAQVFAFVPDEDFKPLLQALRKKRASAVYGGRLAQEYSKSGTFFSVVRELDRQGIFRRIPDADVDAMTEVVCQEGLCVSNDEHIIGLARVANVRLLCSHDADLHADFKNRRILNPPGNVYQDRRHAHLIRRHCQGSRPRKSRLVQ